MRSIIGQIESEHPELFALEFGKIAESNFVYTLATANVDQLVAKMVLMYVTVRSWKSLIINLIGTEWSELFALY